MILDRTNQPTAPERSAERPPAPAAAPDHPHHLPASFPPPPRPPRFFSAIAAASIALPLLLAAVGSAWTWTDVVRDDRQVISHSAELLQETLARAFEVQDALIAALQARTGAMTWPEISGNAELRRLVLALDGATPNTNRVGLIDPTGTMVQISEPVEPPPGISFADRDYFIGLQGAPAGASFVGAPVVGRTSGITVIPYGRPRLAPGGQPDGGVIWTTFSVGNLDAMFARLRADPADSVLLLRNDGTMLARYPAAPAGAPARLAPDSAPMRAIAAIDASGQATATPPRLAGTGFSRGISPFDATDRFFAARAIPHAGVSIVYARPAATMNQQWAIRSLWLLGMAALSSAVLLALVRRGDTAARRQFRAEQHARASAEGRAAAEAARADTEAMLRESQKMELLAQVTAGIVHDVRNTVQTVHAGVALIERAAARGDLARVAMLADMLRQAATRAAQLTQRVLSLRGTHHDEVQACDPRDSIATVCRLLAPGFGTAHRIVQQVADILPPRVDATAAELDSALLNLIINARDAMPIAGDIVIAAELATDPPNLRPGPYVRIRVSDTGIGMDAATLARAAEPFFTTKSRRGTGLGLSSIRTFTHAIGGGMLLESSPGHGTTVTLYLPAAPDPPNDS